MVLRLVEMPELSIGYFNLTTGSLKDVALLICILEWVFDMYFWVEEVSNSVG